MLSKSPVSGTRKMVARAHYLAIQANIQLLSPGGNALDVAIAVDSIGNNPQTYSIDAAADRVVMVSRLVGSLSLVMPVVMRKTCG
ncbi:MAG TPA: hypothetical protein VNG51_23025 [Ktedonobacteraceae bacterium]|nr:hypothetical protein [Ktedonobacteraceae bacterium]